MIRATTFIWRAAGSPPPTETTGEPIRDRDWKAEVAKAGRKLHTDLAEARGAGDEESALYYEGRLSALSTAPTCACCSEPATHLITDAVSDHFTTVRNESRIRPFGGAELCAGCTWCHRTLALRCALWFARPEGIWFQGTWPLKGLPTTRPRALDVLLDPPEPPFVVSLPLAGIEHGGEDALERTMLRPPALTPQILEIRETMAAAAEVLLAARPASVKPEDAKKAAFRSLVTLAAPWPSAVDFADLSRRFGSCRTEPWWRWAVWPLIKLQSKHVAIYARVSTSRERFHLQVDDASDFVLDVALWRGLRVHADGLLLSMRRQGVGARDAVEALTRLRMPPRYRTTARAWRDVTAPMRAHHEAPWWPVFVSLLHVPELTPTPRSRKLPDRG